MQIRKVDSLYFQAEHLRQTEAWTSVFLPVGTRLRADFTGSTGANDVFVEVLQ
jgi:hypothetical protein